MIHEESVQRYCAFFESLSLLSLDDLGEYFEASARFKDPFNDVIGVANIRRVFEHMYTQVHEPAFEILDSMSDANIAFIRWRFRFSLGKRGKTLFTDGVSRVKFAQGGKALAHFDLWDPVEGVYRHLRAFGPAFRWLTRGLAVG